MSSAPVMWPMKVFSNINPSPECELKVYKQLHVWDLVNEVILIPLKSSLNHRSDDTMK